MKLQDVDDDEFLKTGWDDLKGNHVQSWVVSRDAGWTANQVGRCLVFIISSFPQSARGLWVKSGCFWC